MADKMLKIELKKSLIGRGSKQIATANSLGLKKPGDVTVQPDNAATQGKISQIAFMLSVTEA
jgi:large subunit ribosomal protein L30